MKITLSKITAVFGFALVLTAAPALAGAPDAIQLSADDAVLMGLRNNKSLMIKQIAPKITLLKETAARAAFDDTLTGSLTGTVSDPLNGANTATAKAETALSRKFHDGSSLKFGLSSDASDARASSSKFTSHYSISLNTPIARDSGKAVNLASIKSSELDTQTAYNEIKAYSETLISQIFTAYWNYALTCQKIKIYENSLELAKNQLAETEAIAEVGKTAEIEVIAARAEVAQRQQSLVEIRSQSEKQKIALFYLINPDASTWNNPLEPTESYKLNAIDTGSLDDAIALALKSRTDLAQARIQLEKGDLDIVKTKNGLLPYIDFFVTLGGTGYSDSFLTASNGILSDSSDIQFGVSYSAAIGRRAAKSSHEQALLSREQQSISIDNMALTINQDVRNAWIEIDRARQQVEAAGATLRLQEEKLRAESEKFKVGKSTSLTVAQTQRDLLQAQLDESQAIADYSIAMVALYKAQGTLADHYSMTVNE